MLHYSGQSLSTNQFIHQWTHRRPEIVFNIYLQERSNYSEVHIQPCHWPWLSLICHMYWGGISLCQPEAAWLKQYNSLSCTSLYTIVVRIGNTCGVAVGASEFGRRVFPFACPSFTSELLGVFTSRWWGSFAGGKWVGHEIWRDVPLALPKWEVSKFHGWP